MSAIERFCFARWIALIMFTTAIATMMPMIATTIRSSINVNPRKPARWFHSPLIPVGLASS